MKVRRSAWVERPAEQMFDLIERAEHYHRFLPWCTGAVIHERDEHVVAADLLVAFKGVRFQMRTRNPKRRPTHMAIHLERGPFRRFEGVWSLQPLGPTACKVEFGLDYEFDSAVLDRLAGRWFERATDTLVDAFVRQALSEPLAVVLMEPPTDPGAAGPAAGSGAARPSVDPGGPAPEAARPAAQVSPVDLRAPAMAPLQAGGLAGMIPTAPAPAEPPPAPLSGAAR